MSEALGHILATSVKDPGTADILLLIGFRDLETARSAQAGRTVPTFQPFRLLREPVRDEFVLYAAPKFDNLLAAALSADRMEIKGGFFDADTQDLEDVVVHDNLLEARYTGRTCYWRLAAMYGNRQAAQEGREKMEWLEFKAKA